MKNYFINYIIFIIISLLLFMTGCGTSGKNSKQQYDTLQVVATAYNSTEAQTKEGNVGIAAWGDTLKPGMKTIAISRDLLDSGLAHNTEVLIEGFEGTYIVKDKMNKRWNNKIDIYMGLNEEKARNWGKQTLEIYVPVKEETLK